MTKKYHSRKVEKTKCLKYVKWTPSAIYCFERGGVCKGCYYENYFSQDRYTYQECEMKKAVIALVKNIGLPKGIKTKGVRQ